MAQLPKRLIEEIGQLEVFKVNQGPQLIYELGRQVIFSGLPPWPLNAQEPRGANGKPIPVEPFTRIADFHRRRPNGNPIITSGDGSNPQFDQVKGLDFVTLVAQMLHDPAQSPPNPPTDLGPATLAPPNNNILIV